MEEEAREILRQAVALPSTPKNLGRAIGERFAAISRVDLELPPRSATRAPPDFE